MKIKSLFIILISFCMLVSNASALGRCKWVSEANGRMCMCEKHDRDGGGYVVHVDPKNCN